MRPKISNRSATLALLLVGFLAPCPSWAIPTEIAISGFLEDADGRPLDGAFLYQVDFFESEISIASIDTVTSATFITAGVFSLEIVPAPEIVTLDEVWYSLAIDVDRNGLDLMDLFDERFQITSVPFALSGKPVPYYDTHGGYISTSTGTAGNFFNNSVISFNNMVVTPFSTPAGGVAFDRMSVFVHRLSPNVAFSFGIYDEHGQLIVSSGPIESTIELNEQYLEVDHPRIMLRPSTLYFTGVAVEGCCLALRNVIVPSIPLTGLVGLPAPTGVIPASFDPGSIVAEKVIPISITLTLVSD